MDPNKNRYRIPICTPIRVPKFTPPSTTRELSNTYYIYVYSIYRDICTLMYVCSDGKYSM